VTRRWRYENPRNIAASDLIRALRVRGYDPVRQDDSHNRLTTHLGGTHHVTVSNHRPLKTGTLLGGFLKPVASHHKLTVEELLAKLGW
jgi:predicted RNA binding protein YcfA (HicA-like mRNA interferase family)